MDNYQVRYLSFCEAPLEIARLKKPSIILEVLAKSNVIADMQKLQQEYELKSSPTTHNRILNHPLHAIVINEIEFYFMMTGQVPFPMSEHQPAPQQPLIFEADFCNITDLSMGTKMGKYYVLVKHKSIAHLLEAPLPLLRNH